MTTTFSVPAELIFYALTNLYIYANLSEASRSKSLLLTRRTIQDIDWILKLEKSRVQPQLKDMRANDNDHRSIRNVVERLSRK